MGAVKSCMMEFTAVIYPNDWDKQDQLFEDLMKPAEYDPIHNVTIEQYRDEYESGNRPNIDLEDMMRLVREFHESGQTQAAPALTLHKVCAMLGV
jgi:hypothetical protein